jgi:SAM-dependent methyltransferase
MSLDERIAEQARAPSGLFGRLIFWVMGRETREDNRIAVELLDVRATDRVLEIGFGHGRTLPQLTERARDGFVAGIDPSPVMVARAKRRYRLPLHEATGAQIPYDDASFDRICSVHTVYFWREPQRDFAEIRRVLRPDGKLVLGFRAKDDAERAGKYPAQVYRFYDDAELRALAESAGLRNVEFQHRSIHAREIVFLSARG